ncbi:hypothetical protein COW36_23765 [bacterium (Candidatus Blackallbacteria) CG17_big_fil_post_rev_8_21_14_2_50_48_46]|uniref:Urease accessory protein n=1 Tax=bacterium (Candidatus Blackallbacteria) CG17_big_fil_post_rev_8_21_14_2_50_48_46 TaxID=2014261 RepID=A0A2M7FXN6_9BACT|nr:MAG: hypothetical protein COW64_17975 [bacterium (Candidatus Blackallbacteria) CG18_big_fil_WC_8_21_14_2_50_49_26]PIW14055.1 MAG: hypothetical protein COW36_23765 [bacterium (Candidatus Blackallbacteria) CG17_big_fil_post_rev_8_21_14_2_50_48_46]PIW50725.1 MAG: hypothetical protein COW20_01460 [bacterium (Candidatus Blackallbacteria) CG13_big_fil_rev_8_21_14_2_50_49_14]
MGLIEVLLLGLALGIKHALEPDHLIAVSTLLGQEGQILPALRMGAWWGLGHSTTLALGIGLLFMLKLPLRAHHLLYFELPVALMLVFLGLKTLLKLSPGGSALLFHQHGRWVHVHALNQQGLPEAQVRNQLQGFGIGLIHGLAGSGAMALFLAAQLADWRQVLLYTLSFGLGSLLGMTLVSCGMALPFLATRQKPLLHAGLSLLTALLSLGLGGEILWALLHA